MRGVISWVGVGPCHPGRSRALVSRDGQRQRCHLAVTELESIPRGYYVRLGLVSSSELPADLRHQTWVGGV